MKKRKRVEPESELFVISEGSISVRIYGARSRIYHLNSSTGQREPKSAHQQFTLKENTLKRSDVDGSVACYNPKNRRHRKESERFNEFACEDLIRRDEVNLGIFWLKDDVLEESANLDRAFKGEF